LLCQLAKQNFAPEVAGAKKRQLFHANNIGKIWEMSYIKAHI